MGTIGVASLAPAALIVSSSSGGAQTLPRVKKRDVTQAHNPLAENLNDLDHDWVKYAKRIIDGDDTAADFRAALLGSMREFGSLQDMPEPTHRYLPYDPVTCPNAQKCTGEPIDAWFEEASWLNRALTAYRMVRQGIFSANERAELDEWFMQNALFNMEHLDKYGIEMLFPDRSEDSEHSYDRVGVGQADQPYYNLYTSYTPTGEPSPTGFAIKNGSAFFNNRRGAIVYNMILTALASPTHARAQDLIASAKRYIKEWVMFGVYPDGSHADWCRNGDDGIHHQGLIYGASCQTPAIHLAVALALQGDMELAEFETEKGKWGTECTSASQPLKTVWSTFDTHLLIMEGAATFYARGGNLINPNSVERHGVSFHGTWVRPWLRQSRLNRLDSWIATYKDASKIDDPYGKFAGMHGTRINLATGI